MKNTDYIKSEMQRHSMFLPQRLRDTEGYLNKITGTIVDAAFCVHSTLGPGLLEQVYKVCLIIELQNRGVELKSEVFMPVLYKRQIIDIG